MECGGLTCKCWRPASGSNMENEDDYDGSYDGALEGECTDESSDDKNTRIRRRK